MNAGLLLIPFLFVRFILLAHQDKNTIKRAAHFPQMQKTEIIAYWIYQISNIAFFVYLIFLKIIIDNSWIFYQDIMIYIIGLILCTITIINFATPSTHGMNYDGMYMFSLIHSNKTLKVALSLSSTF